MSPVRGIRPKGSDHKGEGQPHFVTEDTAWEPVPGLLRLEDERCRTYGHLALHPPAADAAVDR